MSNHNLKLNWLLFVVCCVSGGITFSQQKTATEPFETKFQRWLPIPNERASKSSPLLDQLSRLDKITDKPTQNKIDGNSPSVNAADVKQLQDFIKQFGDQIPNDLQPPNLEGISAETLSRAMADPEVREKAERLMEQYARSQDRPLPPPRTGTSPNRSAPQTPNPAGAKKSTEEPKPIRNPGLGTQADRSTKQIPDSSQRTPTREELELNPFLPLNSSDIDERTSAPPKEIVQSIEDFLKQVNDSARPASNDRGDATTPPSKRTTSEDIKKQLDQNGFAQTLQRIIEQANESDRRDNLPRSQESKQAPSLPSKRPTISRSTPSQPNPSVPPSPSQPKSSKDNNSAWSDWLNKVMKEVSDSSPAKPDSQPSSPTDTAWHRPFELSMPSPLLLATLVLLCFCVLGLVLYSRRVRSVAIAQREQINNQVDLLEKPNNIRTRADVIRAFHQLAYRIAYPVESWWTHRIIASQVYRTSPSIRSPIDVATAVYEQARYLPSNVSLSADQIDAIRQALKDCGTENN